MNWIEEAAQNADPRKDRVILENPAAIKELDELLAEKYYPPIRRALQDTGYPYSSIDDDAIPIESRWDGPDLGRCLTFMLFDEFGGAILRGRLTRSRAARHPPGKGHLLLDHARKRSRIWEQSLDVR